MDTHPNDDVDSAAMIDREIENKYAEPTAGELKSEIGFMGWSDGDRKMANKLINKYRATADRRLELLRECRTLLTTIVSSRKVSTGSLDNTYDVLVNSEFADELMGMITKELSDD